MTRESPGERRSTKTPRSTTRGTDTPNSACTSDGRRIISVARRALLAKFGATKDPVIAERTSRACLLRPASGEELRRVVALAGHVGAIDEASARRHYPFFQFVLGLAEYRQGHLDRAISLMRGEASGVLGPAPRLVLAMALHQERTSGGGEENARGGRPSPTTGGPPRCATRTAGFAMPSAARPRP